MKDSALLHQLGALVSQQLNPKDVPPTAWPEIIAAAIQQGLSPMLLWVTKRSAPEIVTEPLWTPAIMTARGTGIQYVGLESARKQVNAALDAAHIPSLWLKGIALAHTIYPQPSLRSMSDLDVLVPYDQRQDALRVVEGLGYHFYETNGQLITPQEMLDLDLTHHYHLKGGMNDSVVLEVHFRLLSTDNDLLSLDKLGWFWTQTSTVQNGGQFTILQPEAHLLYLCAHAILQHGEDVTSLRQYFDLHQLITTTPVEWDKVIEQAAVWGWSYAVERALYLATRYFSTPVPDAVFTELRKNHPEHDALADRAVRIQSKGARWEVALLRLNRLSFAERVDVVRHVLFPTRAYMRIRYRLGPDRRVWPAYLYRWFDQGQEIIWAMWNRLTRALGRKK